MRSSDVSNFLADPKLTLAGRPVADIDLATALQPDAVAAALARAGLRAVPTGVDHGTVTALSGGRGFEVTTLRRDVATDVRHAVVDKRQRKTQDRFVARVDGRVMQADLHAALTIALYALLRPLEPSTETVPLS